MFKTFIASALFYAVQAMEMETELELYNEWGKNDRSYNDWGKYGADKGYAGYDQDYGYDRGNDWDQGARGYDAGYGRAGAGASYDQAAKGGYDWDDQNYGKAA